MDYARAIAEAGLEIGAIKLSTDPPFQWASGYIMPIYNDNRMFLNFPEHRKLILKAFDEHLNDILTTPHLDVIAGTATAGIPWASFLAQARDKPLIYIRDKPKSHGLKNRIEGIDADSDLQGRGVLLIEDLISTGGSSAEAVQAIRDANGRCTTCLSIFTYDLDKAATEFSFLDPQCHTLSLLTYDVLLATALDKGYIDDGQERMLAEWRADPFGWGEAHGFPQVVKE